MGEKPNKLFDAKYSVLFLHMLDEVSFFALLVMFYRFLFLYT